ncbi:MAG: transcriptional regulator PpsR [Pseudomonadota bacterium]
MVNPAETKSIEPVRALAATLGPLSEDHAAALVMVASDVALLLDSSGTVRDATSTDDVLDTIGQSWIGSRFAETVTVESRPKVDLLFSDAGGRGIRWREINHPRPGQSDLPLRYCALTLGNAGQTVLFGRDLRSLSGLQQKLIASQMSIERDYARLREANTRYRLLFQLSTEAIIVADADRLTLVDINPVAARLAGVKAEDVVGTRLTRLFEADSIVPLESVLAATRSIGRGEEVEVRLKARNVPVTVSASLFRQENTAHLLIRMGPALGRTLDPAPARSAAMDVLAQLPDAFVVTDDDHRILEANLAFVDLLQLGAVEQVRGQVLGQWFERPGVDLNVLIANLREHGSARRFPTVMRGALGSVEHVEIAAVAVPQGAQAIFGFAIRNVGRPERVEPSANGFAPRSADQLTELIGHMSLKEVVRETTDVIERMCIEAALDLTSNNRASAAQVLGLSRQSLYSKLRRHGIHDNGSAESADTAGD